MSPTQEKIYNKLGFFGSSHVEHFEDETLKKAGIKTTLLSCDPKNVQGIISTRKTERIITEIQLRHINIDAVLIMVGGNDIQKNCKPKDLFSNLLKIASLFEEINIEPIIVPLINRTQPRNVEHEDQYKMIRNRVNSNLKRYLGKRNKNIMLKIDNLPLCSDGVHLTSNS